MAAGWLKNAVIGASTPSMSIIQRLKMNVGGVEAARSKDVVHASDVTKPNFCPRHWALLDITGKKSKNDYLSTAQRATYDIGNATATVVTDKWLGDAAIGNWRCLSCGDQRTFCTKPGNGCKKLGNCHWHYDEVKFVSKEYGISGSVDVFVDLGVFKVQTTELKIIKAEDFDALKQPLAEHTVRTKLYLKLIADSDSAFKDKINLHEGRVLYVSRGYGKANLDHDKEILPFKEYKITREDERLKPFLGRAKQIKVFRDNPGAATVPSGICAQPGDVYAKSCTTCKECFSGVYPPAQPALVK